MVVVVVGACSTICGGPSVASASTLVSVSVLTPRLPPSTYRRWTPFAAELTPSHGLLWDPGAGAEADTEGESVSSRELDGVLPESGAIGVDGLSLLASFAFGSIDVRRSRNEG